jgi:uncharacterized membrane protein AbrB (regulator of aidB expression)
MRDLGVALGIGLVAAGLGARTGLPGASIVLPILAVAGWNLFHSRQAVSLPSGLQLVTFGLLGTTIGLTVDRGSLETLRNPVADPATDSGRRLCDCFFSLDLNRPFRWL